MALIEAAGLKANYQTFISRARAYLECGRLAELRAVLDEGARAHPPLRPNHGLNKVREPVANC